MKMIMTIPLLALALVQVAEGKNEFKYMGYTEAEWFLWWNSFSLMEWAKECALTCNAKWTVAEWALYFSRFSPREWHEWLTYWVRGARSMSRM